MSCAEIAKINAPPIINVNNTTADGKQIFITAGQSNMKGNGDETTSLSPIIGGGFKYSVPVASLVHLKDPLIFDGIQGTSASRDSNTGSLIPAFSKSYNEATGLKAVIILSAYGGSGLSSIQTIPYWAQGAPGRWLYNDLIVDTDNALSLIGVQDPRGILWSQGETGALELITNSSYNIGAIPIPDASGNFDWSAISQDVLDFEAVALCKIIDDFKTKYPNTPFYFIQTGTSNSANGTGRSDYPTHSDCYDAIAQLQVDMVAFWNDSAIWDTKNINKKGGVYMAYPDTKSFHVKGWMKADNLHYNQLGLNDIGTKLGTFIKNNQ